MAKRIAGQNFEGRYFIITVPDDWTEKELLPPPSADDRWFDRLSDFKAALDCPWIRTPLRHAEYRLAHVSGASLPHSKRAVGE